MNKCMVKQASMAYRDEGQGHPVVMGHSFLWDADMWQAQTLQLKKTYRCIVPDLWSHGKSDPLPYESCSLETLAEDYWQFTQALSLEKFALIGLSVGGMWAAHLALAHPEAVSALVLMDTYVGEEAAIPQAIYMGMLDEMASGNRVDSELATEIAPYFFGKNTKDEQPQLIEDFIQKLLASPEQHIPGKVALGRAIFNRQSILHKLKNIDVPTLIIVGAEDLPRPPQEAQEMAKLIPNAQLEIVPKAGHICTVERPQYVNDLIDRFLQSVLVQESVI